MIFRSSGMLEDAPLASFTALRVDTYSRSPKVGNPIASILKSNV